MRAGIPDRLSSERTITLHLDKELFKQALDNDLEEMIHLILVDRQGNISQREQRVFSEIKVSPLLDKLDRPQ